MLKQQSVLVGDIDGILVGIEKQKVCLNLIFTYSKLYTKKKITNFIFYFFFKCWKNNENNKKKAHTQDTTQFSYKAR